jgi:prepilin-type processing-associated H-X9-DG protein
MTVIELAIIILIVLVLAAILLPWYNRPHPMRRASCLNNVKQIDLALIMYAEGSGDVGPPVARWPDRLQPYLRSRQLYVCPKAPKLPIGYIYGAHVPLRPLHEFAHPEAVLAFWEGDPGARTFAFRHNGVLNVGYADGHARGLTSEELNRGLLDGYADGIRLKREPSD